MCTGEFNIINQNKKGEFDIVKSKLRILIALNLTNH